MSGVGNKRNREKSRVAIDDDTKAPSKKRHKIDHTLEIIKSVHEMRVNRGHKQSWSYSTNDLETCFQLLLTIQGEDRKEIIMKSCDTCKISSINDTVCATCQLLLDTITCKSYKYIGEFFVKDQHKTTYLSEINKMKINIIRKITYPIIISNGECNRTPILIINLGNEPKHTNYSFFDKSCNIEYYNGAISTLEEFTADVFLESVKDFNFFRFVKTVPNEDENIEISCVETEVLNFLDSIKYRDPTFVLLIFFMVAYYKNFIYKSIKNAVQSVSGIDTDTLSEIMSFMLTYYESFNKFFQDKDVIRYLMGEIRYASEDWQNVFVDIIENDDEYKQLYESDMKRYYSSEKLNLLNLKMNKEFNFEQFKKLMKPAVKNGHYDLFTKLMEEYCDNKMDGFKYLFWYCAPHSKGEKWFQVIENQINKFKETIKCESELNEFESLCDGYKAKVKKHRKTKKSKENDYIWDTEIV